MPGRAEVLMTGLKKSLFIFPSLLLCAALMLAWVKPAMASQPIPSVACTAAAPAPSYTYAPTGTPAPAPTISPEAIPLPADDPPESFFTSDEKVTISPQHDRWTYSGPELYVDIQKVRLKSKDLTFFVADIRTKDAGEFTSGYIPGRKLPGDFAKQYKAVYAQNGDFCTIEKGMKGILIRGGKVLSNKKAADTMTILPDGTMKIFSPGETTPQKLLDMGVRDAWSFGPTLIRDGVLHTSYNKYRNHGKNPRSGFGMIEPGHYIGIVVGGRNPGYSVGMTYLEFAKLFQQYGCVQAYCFDGGASSAMVFMGEPMEVKVKMTGTNKLTQRRIPDMFILGTSELVK